MRKLNNKGFTIIELLVVIVIIGILIALALPNLFSAQARGRDTDRKNELKNLQTKLETYFNDNDSYPDGDMAAAATDLGITDADEYTGPRNDVYTYEPGPAGCDNADENCNSYVLRVRLENEDDRDAQTVNSENGWYVINSTNQ